MCYTTSLSCTATLLFTGVIEAYRFFEYYLQTKFMQNTTKRISILVVALLPVAVLGWFVLKTDTKTTLAEAVVVFETSSTASSTKTASKSSTSSTTQGASSTKASSTTSASSSATSPNTPIPVATAPVPAPVVSAPVSMYKDGTYSVTTSYRVPEAPQQSMGVKVTLKGDVITDVVVTELATDGTSRMYQDAFVGGYKTFVVGKNIAEISLSRVSGASLTSKSFNDALSLIMSKAVM